MFFAFFTTLCLFAGAFWSERPPAQWTDQEIDQLLTDSPWARLAAGIGQIPEVQVYLATAAPIRQAEAEQKRRAGKNQQPDPSAEEYRLWLEENRSSQLILAIRVKDSSVYANRKELDRLEKESVMRVGRKKIQMTGYFPPTAADPYLRVAFPREVAPSDRQVRFELYVPGITGPFREVEFKLDPMVLNGKLEL